MKPLSNRQKAVLAQIARRAFNQRTASGQLQGITFDDWRREEVERATGLPGLRFCGNDHYNSVGAHFQSLAGEDGRAFNHLVDAQTDKRRQLEVVLLETLARAGLPPTYAESISRARFKCAVLETNTAQLRQLVMTVKARARARNKIVNPKS